MAKTFSLSPSEILCIEDIKIAFEVIRICNIRLLIFDCWVREQQNNALESDSSHFPPQFTPELYQHN